MIPSIVSLHVLGPSITITKKLFKDRNYSHFPYEESEIQKLRHLPKHVMKPTWLRVTIAHFVKDGASFLPCTLVGNPFILKSSTLKNTFFGHPHS